MCLPILRKFPELCDQRYLLFFSFDSSDDAFLFQKEIVYKIEE